MQLLVRRLAPPQMPEVDAEEVGVEGHVGAPHAGPGEGAEVLLIGDELRLALQGVGGAGAAEDVVAGA